MPLGISKKWSIKTQQTSSFASVISEVLKIALVTKLVSREDAKHSNQMWKTPIRCGNFNGLRFGLEMRGSGMSTLQVAFLKCCSFVGPKKYAFLQLPMFCGIPFSQRSGSLPHSLPSRSSGNACSSHKHWIGWSWWYLDVYEMLVPGFHGFLKFSLALYSDCF